MLPARNTDLTQTTREIPVEQLNVWRAGHLSCPHQGRHCMVRASVTGEQLYRVCQCSANANLGFSCPSPVTAKMHKFRHAQDLKVDVWPSIEKWGQLFCRETQPPVDVKKEGTVMHPLCRATNQPKV